MEAAPTRQREEITGKQLGCRFVDASHLQLTTTPSSISDENVNPGRISREDLSMESATPG